MREALVALYRTQTRHDRQRAVVLDAVQRASRLEAEKLVEALAQLYVDDAPRGTQERRRAERLFERVMLSRAYRRLAKGHVDHARDVFREVAETTGSLEAHVGYVDLRLREGASAEAIRAEYARHSGERAAPVSQFVHAYLLARELPSLKGAAREARHRRSRSPACGARRRRCAASPSRRWSGARSCTSATSAGGGLAPAQKANLHYLLALDLVTRNPRYRAHLLAELALVQSEAGNWRIALGFLDERDKLPLADDAAGIEERLVKARTLLHLDREEDAAAAADEALAVVTRTPALAELRPLVARSRGACATWPPAASPARSRSTTRSCPRCRASATSWSRGWRAPAPRSGPTRRAAPSPTSTPSTTRSPTTASPPELAWPHTTPAATLRSYRLIATGLRANAHLRLGELDAAQAALERRRTLVAERLAATGLDEHLRALGLVEARLASVARERHDAAGATRWLRLAFHDVHSLREEDAGAAAGRPLRAFAARLRAAPRQAAGRRQAQPAARARARRSIRSRPPAIRRSATTAVGSRSTPPSSGPWCAERPML